MHTDQISHGVFPPDHPSFANMEWYGISHIPSDKTHKLSLTNPQVRDTELDFRYPVLTSGYGPNLSRDWGGALKRYLSLLGTPGRLYRKIHKNNKGYYPKNPLGLHTIRQRFREAFKFMGFDNWESLRPHALRSLFCDTLANDPSVNCEEMMAAARHNSISASAAYQRRTHRSETNRINALLGKRKHAESEVDSNSDQNFGTIVVRTKKIAETPQNSTSSRESTTSTSSSSSSSLASSWHNNNNYSIYTQRQINLLNSEMHVLPTTPNPLPNRVSSRRYISRQHETKGNQPVFSTSRRFVSHQQRERSEREIYLYNLRMEMQERMADFPFRTQEEEDNILYQDSVEEEVRREMEIERRNSERNYRIDRRRRIALEAKRGVWSRRC